MKTADALVAVDEALRTGAPGAADPAERELQEIALPPERAEPQAAPAREPEARTAVPEPGDAAAAGRRVERAAELTLAAPADRLDDVANDVVQVTDRHRGVVLDSSVATGSDPARGAAFTLRVPATELSQTLRDLSRLGQVRARSESGHDVTRSYDRLRDRLDAARVE